MIQVGSGWSAKLTSRGHGIWASQNEWEFPRLRKSGGCGSGGLLGAQRHSLRDSSVDCSGGHACSTGGAGRTGVWNASEGLDFWGLGPQPEGIRL